jgi:hypothetical protein
MRDFDAQAAKLIWIEGPPSSSGTACATGWGGLRRAELAGNQFSDERTLFL